MKAVPNSKISARSWVLLDRLWIDNEMIDRIIEVVDDNFYGNMFAYSMRRTAFCVAKFVQSMRITQPETRKGYIFRMQQRRRADGLYRRHPRTNAKSLLMVARSPHYIAMTKTVELTWNKRSDRYYDFNRTKRILQELAAKWDTLVLRPNEVVNRELLDKLLISRKQADEIMDSLLLLEELLQFVYEQPVLGIGILSMSDIDEPEPMTISAFISLMFVAQAAKWNPQAIRKVTGVHWRQVDQDRLIKLSRLLLDLLKTNPKPH